MKDYVSAKLYTEMHTHTSCSQRAEFKIYIPYCKNKPTSDKTRIEYDSFFSQRQSELGHKLSIEDLLIAPVQRLPKYQLLIRVGL